MYPGRNATRIRKRLSATATLTLLVGAAFVAATPATAALNFAGAGAGSLDSVWGITSDGAADGGDAQGQYDGDMQGSASGAAEGAAEVWMAPPDPQPHIDEAQRTVAEAQAKVQGEADALLAQKDHLAAGGAASWGLYGSGDGSYDVVLGGDYAGGLEGLAGANGGKEIRHNVDARGHEEAAGAAAAEAEGALNGLLQTVEELYGKLHASFDLGLDGAAKAIGGIGMDIAGIFGFQQGAELVNTDQLSLQKHVDVAAPAMTFSQAELPSVDIPDLAVDQGGEVGADAAAAAEGIVKG